ncbi:MAG: hypothetical protein MRY59_10175 [Aquisalinus sp.]|nr:hypothetical protein [Aquisalinus sp.]
MESVTLINGPNLAVFLVIFDVDQFGPTVSVFATESHGFSSGFIGFSRRVDYGNITHIRDAVCVNYYASA